MHLINALLQPYTRTVEFLLRAELPEPAQEVVVYPEVAFIELTGLEEGVAQFVYLEDASEKGRAWDFLIGFGPVMDAGVI